MSFAVDQLRHQPIHSIEERAANKLGIPRVFGITDRDTGFLVDTRDSSRFSQGGA